MINNVTLMGRLTAAPELKRTQSDTGVTAFRVAVDRSYQTKDGEKQTDFITCVAWRGTAEFICKYFDKGDFIAVTGEIQTRNYTDKDGNKRTAVEVVVNQASFCGGKNSGNNTDNAQPASHGVNVEYDNDDELPF